MTDPSPSVKVIRHWVLGPGLSIRPVKSFGGNVFTVCLGPRVRYILKRKASQERLQTECDLLLELSRRNVPVAVPLPASNGRRYVKRDGAFYCVYPYLQGKVYRHHFTRGGLARARMFGEAIAQLHRGLAACETPPGIKTMDLTGEVTGWAWEAISKRPDQCNVTAISHIVEDFRRGFGRLQSRIPAQLIHRDAHSGNMVFLQGRVSGFFDLEIAVFGPRVFDVCYCATSILISGFGSPTKRRHWLRLFRELVRGYHGRNRLSRKEVKSMIWVLEAIQIIFQAFSLNTGNLAAAKCNETALLWLDEHHESIEKSLSEVGNPQTREFGGKP